MPTITPPDVGALLAAVRTNQAVLAACPGHTFERLVPGRLFSKYRCAACGGTVDLDFKSGYEQGLDHGKTPVGAP